jgi:hypothetical protein
VKQGPRDEAAIRTPDRRLRVFVSSTLGELAEERRSVGRAVSALRLTPVMFEAGARPYPPAEVYRAYLAQADVFIGVYWQRYGQLVPGAQVSGLEEEFDLSAGLPRLLYVKGPAPDREPRLADLLARIQAESSASYRHFRTPAELGRLVRDDLAVLLSERFAAASGPAPAAAPAGARGPRPLPVSPPAAQPAQRTGPPTSQQNLETVKHHLKPPVNDQLALGRAATGGPRQGRDSGRYPGRPRLNGYRSGGLQFGT